MKILLDGMGGDHAPEVIVEGAVAATKELEKDVKIAIIGQEEIIAKELKKTGYTGDAIEIIHADEVITNHESPVKAIRTKKESTIVKGINLLKEGEVDVFISAGSTGAVLAGGLLILGRIKGVDRPALATIYPVIGKEPALLLDAGANAECKPKHLLEFGIMGSLYMEKVLGRTDPRVGLVNNGAEEGKGNALTKETYGLLKESNLNFVGNVEARDIPTGAADVIVTDGFTGNVIIKLSEGLGLTILREIKRKFTAGGVAKLGAALLKGKLYELKQDFDYTEYGGAPILGVRGAILKMHGSSDFYAVKQTILKAVPYVKENVVEKIAGSIGEDN
ncbi:MAG: phosphate acyltransferase PlsX [Peptostreptococcaceae bacterium]|nr:phosphate acyltransferase PlsX [Peptostreptococcaceae bacterium]MDY5738890.1 phosphate acyltransferase PlsX [Anaerovoracaceae bacterium]SFE39831.1 phosphate:acyl-[acyl carrier protein] acyltransferase [Peptostreptococcaceae bacterium pGA-8]